MSPTKALRLGTRGSDLALWQAHRIAAVVEQRLERQCEIEIIKTRGDRIQDVAFRKMEGKGFFTKELQDALMDDRIDLVVHSLKDLPTEEPPGLEVVAVTERADPRDVLLARSGLLEPTPARPLGLPDGVVVGTSSLRRASQVLATHPAVEIRALRGNVPTRIARLRDGGYDAILLAAAGIDRLELDIGDLERIDLDPEVLLSAPGQGALAIETRAGDERTGVLAALHDPLTGRCVTAERRLLELLGGGCHLPLGCLATDDEADGLRLQAVLGRVDDEVTSAEVARVGGCAADPETAANICYQALRLAMPEVVGA
jgi:hydroxymethylbilane synthase